MKKITHDKDNDIIAIQLGKLGKQHHIGVSEEINLIGVTIVIDRNKRGEVKGLEII